MEDKFDAERMREKIIVETEESSSEENGKWWHEEKEVGRRSQVPS